MTNREAGKGDTQRPTDHKSFSENFDAIFGKKTKEEPAKPTPDTPQHTTK